jgi:hypothetical protein
MSTTAVDGSMADHPRLSLDLVPEREMDENSDVVR